MIYLTKTGFYYANIRKPKKFVSESLEDILKPKSREEIKKIVRGREDSIKLFSPYTSNNYFLLLFNNSEEDQEKLRKFSWKHFNTAGFLNSDKSMMNNLHLYFDADYIFILIDRFSSKKYMGRVKNFNVIDCYNERNKKIEINEAQLILDKEFKWVKSKISESLEDILKPKELNPELQKRWEIKRKWNEFSGEEKYNFLVDKKIIDVSPVHIYDYPDDYMNNKFSEWLANLDEAHEPKDLKEN